MSDMRIKSKVAGLVSMRGYWIKSMVVFLIVALLSFGISELEMTFRNVYSINLLDTNGNLTYDYRSIIVEAVATVLEILVISPLILGTFEWFLKIIEGKSPKIGDIFVWYGSGKLFGKSLLLTFNIAIRSALWAALIYCIPTALGIFGMKFYNKAGTNFSNLTNKQAEYLLLGSVMLLFCAVLYIAATFLYLYITTKYIPAFYLFAADKSMKTTKAIKDSIRYTKGYRWEYTKFVLSYIGWFITCALIFPIFYVFPYFFASLTVFSKSIICSQRMKENNDNTKSFDKITPPDNSQSTDNFNYTNNSDSSSNTDNMNNSDSSNDNDNSINSDSSNNSDEKNSSDNSNNDQNVQQL